MELDLVVIGGGNMGTALLGGLLAAGTVGAHDVAVIEPNADRRAQLEAEFPGVAMAESMLGARSAIVAVKPQHVADALTAAKAAGVRRVLSVAAGVTTESMSAVVGPEVAIVRAMPNTPALVGQGVTAIAAGPGAGATEMEWARTVLSAVGMVVEVDEHQLDAVTGLTGSGPAYLFLVAEALIGAGVAEGLPEHLVEPMVTQLLVGSAALLAERGDPGALRVAVTSPGGTTAAGLSVLDGANVPAAFAAAVDAATKRSQELGRAK